ncbi:MAG: hypothetical protein MK160_05410 [Rhodobacteraceae bacterium]|nr:hypothetical protein [Paracoccaceae bacterium]
MRFTQIALALLLILPVAGLAHPGHTPRGPDFGPGVGDEGNGGKDRGVSVSSLEIEADADNRALPDLIKSFDAIRLTGSEFRTLRHRIRTNPGKPHIEGLSNDLALIAAEAGSVAPLAVGQLLFKMWKTPDTNERIEILSTEIAKLSSEQARLHAWTAETGTQPRATKRKLRTNQLMMALVTAWSADPTNGVN